jgi:hypothetical protein
MYVFTIKYSVNHLSHNTLLDSTLNNDDYSEHNEIVKKNPKRIIDATLTELL